MTRADELAVLDRLDAAAAELRAILSAVEAPRPPAATTPAPAPVSPPPAPPQAPARGLQSPAVFFDHVRGKLWPRLGQGQVDGCKRIINACASLPVAWTAYALATSFHETAFAMQPVRERGNGDRDGDGEDDYFQKYDVGPLAARLGNTPEDDGDGGRYCGRGDTQLTGKSNYSRATGKLQAAGFDVDLVKDPELALRPDLSALILRWGMQEGWFTGKTFADFLPVNASLANFTSARRIINGTDRAAQIAAHAMTFQQALLAGGYA